MPSIEERFSTALHNTARAWRQALDRRLKGLGVSQASWMTIAVIAKAKQSLSQTELAHALAVEDPTMVAMIDRLVKVGFVLRVPSETDRRVKHITLTQAGNQLYEKVKAEADVFRTELLANVDTSTLETLTVLLETLQTVAELAP